MAQSVNNKEENTIIVYDLSGTEALRYMSEKEKQNVIENNNNNEEIVIDVGECKTAEEVFSQLSKMSHIFDKDKDNDNILRLKDSNKKIFWLKVDEKLYIKFDSCIRLDGDLLSSMHYRINDGNKQLKPRLPVVSFDKDCVKLNIKTYDNEKETYYTYSNNCFHFHKNEEAKRKGKLYFDTQESVRFKTKGDASMQTLYRDKTTYLSNIGNAYYYKPSQLPLAVCGVNLLKNEKEPSCLCGIGCCSPYGMIDEAETKNLNDIFPQFDLEKANKQNEENIVQ